MENLLQVVQAEKQSCPRIHVAATPYIACAILLQVVQAEKQPCPRIHVAATPYIACAVNDACSSLKSCRRSSGQ